MSREKDTILMFWVALNMIDNDRSMTRKNSLAVAAIACVANGILSRVRGQRQAMAAEPRDSKAVPFHSPRDFAARIPPLSKFYFASEQSRQLRRLS